MIRVVASTVLYVIEVPFSRSVSVRREDMANTEPPIPIRERIKELNTKAYYLLVALSFVYRMSSTSYLMKWAFTLMAVAAVSGAAPDLRMGARSLPALKVNALTLALV